VKAFVATASVVLVAVLPQPAQAEVYAACYYQDGNTGAYPFTQLFTLDDYALKDSYGEYTRDKTAVWEQEFAKEVHEVREIGSYYGYSFVGQFVKFAEDEKKERGSCWMTTDKAHALGWYRSVLAKGKWDKLAIQDWRPSKGTALRVEEWPAN
jgi:hypothetical protein